MHGFGGTTAALKEECADSSPNVSQSYIYRAKGDKKARSKQLADGDSAIVAQIQPLVSVER